MKTPHVLGAFLLLASASVAHASDPSAPWEYEGRIYLWGSSVGGTTATGQDVDISFSEVLDTLDFALMGGIEARKGRWSILGDFQYLELSDDANAAVGPGIPAQADADITGFVFGAAIGYDLATQGTHRVTPFAGLRYLDMDVTANLSLGPGSVRRSGSRTNTDGIVGIRGNAQIAERWYVSYYADVGAGDSDLTWQLAGTLDYRLSDALSLSLGYRHMQWDFNDPVILQDVSFSGPIFGARLKF